MNQSINQSINLYLPWTTTQEKKSMSTNNSPGRTVRLNTALNTALIKTNKIRYARQMQYRYTTNTNKHKHNGTQSSRTDKWKC